MPSPHTNRIMDQAKIRLPGAIDAALLLEFYSVLKEFFGKSNAWREEIEFTTVAGQRDYSLVAPAGVVNRLFGVLNADKAVVPASMALPGEVVLGSDPEGGHTLTAFTALNVSDSTATSDFPVYPEWIVDKYHEVFLDGLLGKMMSQIAKPYTSPPMALMHLRAFRFGVNQARSEAIRANVYAAQPWGFPRAFAE